MSRIAARSASAGSPDPPSTAEAARLRVVHVIPGLRQHDGGPAYSVPALAGALLRAGADPAIRTVGDVSVDPELLAGVPVHSHGRAAGLFGKYLRASPDLLAALVRDAGSGAVLHAHGLWLAPNLYPARARNAAAGRPPLVISPRGMLGREALAISAWKKKLVWTLGQRAALEAADCLHATAAAECQSIREAGLRNPVAVIPNGIDCPNLPDRRRSPKGGRVVLSLGRIHPKKGLDRLVRAFAPLEARFPEWRLRIVGPAEVGHDDELRALAASLGAERISIEPPTYDRTAKLRTFRDADLFVLPTKNENFGMTVCEALVMEVPVISTKGAPWQGLEIERCGWWIDHGVEPLSAALEGAMRLGEADRYAMGARGRDWMARDFGWQRIGADMLDVYRWLKSGGEPPPTIDFGGEKGNGATW